jgi:2-polyprenyl-3-methyl-5-hydroxy-6-metoxy-1,4-benzoquinol methylase
MKKTNLVKEKKRLAQIGKDFTMGKGLTEKLGQYFVQIIKNDLINGYILDVGCADGIMAKRLSPFVKHMTAIDGSEKLIKKAKKLKLNNVDFIFTLFEEYRPKKQFDTIILSDILEHINEPVKLLSRCNEWIKENGVVIIISPNATSIHRQIGVLAGMLRDVHELNPTDIRVGHRRVYDIKILKQDIKKAGLKIIKSDGFFLKPLSDSQLENLPDKVINAFYLIGNEVPKKFLALLYVVCGK